MLRTVDARRFALIMFEATTPEHVARIHTLLTNQSMVHMPDVSAKISHSEIFVRSDLVPLVAACMSFPSLQCGPPACASSSLKHSICLKNALGRPG